VRRHDAGPGAAARASMWGRSKSKIVKRTAPGARQPVESAELYAVLASDFHGQRSMNRRSSAASRPAAAGAGIGRRHRPREERKVESASGLANWPTLRQAQALAPDITTTKRLHVRAILAVFLGGALRRSAVAELTDGRHSGGFTLEATGDTLRAIRRNPERYRSGEYCPRHTCETLDRLRIEGCKSQYLHKSRSANTRSRPLCRAVGEVPSLVSTRPGAPPDRRARSRRTRCGRGAAERRVGFAVAGRRQYRVQISVFDQLHIVETLGQYRKSWKL
jgi:hypothetical protein